MGASRVKIEVRLTKEGREILGTEWAALDLPQGFSPRFSKDVNQLSDVNKLVTDGMLNFSLPQSKTNDIAFMQSGSPVITDNIDTGIECRIWADGRQYPFDRVWVKNKQAGSWEVEVRRSPNHWLELASMKKLNTIDLGSETVDDDIFQNLADQYYVDGGPIARWIPCDYGNWVDLSEPQQHTDPPVKHIYYEDLRPWICLPELLKRGFCEIGWTLQGQILGTRWSRSLFCYILSREYYTQSRGGNQIVIGLNTVGFVPNSFVTVPILYNLLQYDPGTNNVPITGGYAAGIYNTLPYRAKYRFFFVGTFKNNTGSFATIGIAIADFSLSTGLPTGDIYWTEDFEFQANEERIITIEQYVDLDSQTRGVFISGPSTAIEIKPGFRVIMEPGMKSLVRGDTVDLNALVHADYLLLDAFKAYVHMIGGRIETDLENKTVSVYPYKYADAYGDPAEGFIQEDEHPIELDGKVICDTIQLSRIRNNLPRYTRLAFADSTDSYVSEFVKPQDPLFSRKVLNGEDLQDTVQELKNPFFEPTFEAQPQVLRRAKTSTGRLYQSPYFPILHDNTEGNRSFAIGPRVLLFYGKARQMDDSSGLDARAYIEDALNPGTATSAIGYGAHVPTFKWLEGYEPEIDAKLTYGTYPDDMYVKFYLDTLTVQKTGFNVNLLALVTGTDYSAWNFRRKFLHTIAGKPVLMLGQRIRDFAASLDIPTPIDLIVEAPSTTCCELPCGCRFTECDYYQDFGQYMTQDTLDQLSITSFKVNEVEQLLAPVEFGILKIVEFAGRQFIINMVDALTACGVDYFSFRPSSQVYDPKPDARFFKIKRPACWTFEIVISDGEGEVYRYTESTMEQKWFGGGDWEPFGYEGDLLSEPSNCVPSTEY